jgi:DNA-directed RNA polymerase subunit M/transcription elongation factor TFIIS
MYYIRLIGENEDKLVYYCRKCGHEDSAAITALENICVSKTDVQQTGDSYNHVINEYTKLDPTLPYLTNIKCPNAKCATNEQEDTSAQTPAPKVLYLRYDDANMKFVYICAHCETVWKSADDK